MAANMVPLPKIDALSNDPIAMKYYLRAVERHEQWRSARGDLSRKLENPKLGQDGRRRLFEEFTEKDEARRGIGRVPNSNGMLWESFELGLVEMLRYDSVLLINPATIPGLQLHATICDNFQRPVGSTNGRIDNQLATEIRGPAKFASDTEVVPYYLYWRFRRYESPTELKEETLQILKSHPNDTIHLLLVVAECERLIRGRHAGPVWRSYAGVTMDQIPLDRATKSMTTWNSSACTRFGNWETTARRLDLRRTGQWNIYSIPVLHSSLSKRQYELSHSHPSMERDVITNLGMIADNSAPGGFLHRPLQDLYVTYRYPGWLRVDPGDIRSIETQLERHYVDMRDTWEHGVKPLDRGRLISDEAADGVRRAMMGMTMVHGRVITACVGKDLPEKNFLSTDVEMFWFGNRRGQTAWLSWVNRMAAMGLDGWDEANLSEDMRIRTYGPFVDLWCLVLRHGLVWLAILFLSRYMNTVRPLVTRVYSSKMATIFLGDC